jgi:hypothetical protein
MMTTATKKSTVSMDWRGGSKFLEKAVTNCNILHGVKKPKTVISQYHQLQSETRYRVILY